MKTTTVFLFILLSLQAVSAQYDIKDKLKGYVNPEELVTLSEDIPFDQAVQVLSKVSEKIAGKKIISTVNLSTPIGIEINRMQYKKALIVLVQYNNLMFDETETGIFIRKKEEPKTKSEKDNYVSSEEREVKISALLFEANIDELRERGINWEFLLSQSGISIGSKLATIQDQSIASTTAGTTSQVTPEFANSTSSTYKLGPWDGTATGLFRFFETENLGRIIARPIISARSGVEGKTQIGSEFSIKERDFAGNLIDKFYPTGTIVDVTPYVFNEKGLNYVLLKLRVERSSIVSRDALSTEVSKNIVTTDVILLNGEESAIGGLFENQEITIRNGIPVLKDLPWWVFGIRYLTGYDSREVIKKEIIMLIRAEILPSIKERIQKSDSVLRDMRKENVEQMQKYDEQLKKDEPEKK